MDKNDYYLGAPLSFYEVNSNILPILSQNNGSN